MVYRDGLENRCAGNRTGGSNPSPSAKGAGKSYEGLDEQRLSEFVKQLLPVVIVLLIAMGVFIWFWREGAFLKVSAYCKDTQDELKKCTWPNWDELVGSTTVVLVSVAFLGGFTVAVDLIVAALVKALV